MTLVQLLDDIETRRSGQNERPLELRGNAWFAIITKDQVELDHHWVDGLRGTVPIDCVLSVMRA